MPASSAVRISAASASGRIMVPVGLAGLATRSPASFCLRCSASTASGVTAQRVDVVGLDQHRLAAERLEDVAIGRIAGIGDADAVAGLEHRKKSQDETRRRAGGDDHPRRIEIDIIGLAIMARDPRPQRADAERLGVAKRPIERAPRGLDRGPRRGRGRLPDFHVNDMMAGGLDARGRRDHVHHHEGRNIAARRRATESGERVPASDSGACLSSSRVRRHMPRSCRIRGACLPVFANHDLGVI